MPADREHRAVSPDGTEIAGSVHGVGPPLVLVHGAMADGECEWAAVVPFLRDRFTCHLVSTRNRGASGRSPDLAPQRLAEDVTAYVESIGEPVRLAGVSGGGMWVLAAAAQSAAVSAVAAHEPVVFEVIDGDTLAGFEEALEAMVEAAAAGDHAEAARIFLEGVTNDDELAVIAAKPGYLDAAGRNVHVDLEEIRQTARSEGFSATDPSRLARISVPVLLTYGAATPMPWFRDGVQHVAAHVADPRLRELPGCGHLATAAHPDQLAGELAAFFERAPARA
ncbi:alpha/beta hydrolase [Egibacter rhizosphaerae]|uniref:Alpha/beta hydrolase n=1 Tax=Egibacter rhizosphaerae TaxID=1670831 RepID=A0A411YFT9_9ACTN|nr:alpha/beta hydrolase [Egibacter rhizosphaerae]QBI20103.1 alpha/beta hydrolase [Egibacter rhizosphaerae]